jgi:predicted 3-demethylubiquinone-9 3-methyltransferase (glyoxalase superfamily)
MVRIRPFLWFDAQAEDAAKLYTSIFEGSEIKTITRKPAGVPGPTDVLVVTFTVAGQEVVAMNGGPGHPQTDAFSLAAEVETQAEVDRIWMRLLEGGGKEIACGWLRDRFGVHWQVTPTILLKLMADPNPKKAAAVAGAMMKMVKLDVARLKAAYDAA